MIRDAYFIYDPENVALLIEEWSSFTGSILSNLQAFDIKYNFEIGTAISLYKHALAKKLLKVNMNEKINLNDDVSNVIVPTLSDSKKRWA